MILRIRSVRGCFKFVQLESLGASRLILATEHRLDTQEARAFV